MTHNERPIHKQVTLEFNGKTVEVDEGLAELLPLIWERGIPTAMSCQNNNGRVWIYFHNVEHLTRFLNAVGHTDNEAMYRRILGFVGPMTSWKYELVYTNQADWESIDGRRGVVTPRKGPVDFSSGVSLRFPESDLDEVIRVLQQ